MTKEPNDCGVSRDGPVPLNDGRRFVLNRAAYFGAPIVAMNFAAQLVARRYILLLRSTNGEAGDGLVERLPIHVDQRSSYLESQFRVKRERTAMESRLH